MVPCWLIVPPFLIRLLHIPDFPHKEAAIEVLAAFMLGYAWWTATPAAADALPPDRQAPAQAAALATTLAELYGVVRVGLPRYLQLLAAMPRPVPTSLIELLTLLEKDVHTIAPQVWQYFEEQADPEVLWQLQELVAGKPEYYEWFDRVMRTHPDPGLRRLGAVCLAHLLETQTNAQAIAVLTEKVLEPQLNWPRITALRLIPAEDGVPTLLWMLRQVPTARDAHELVGVILMAIFPEVGKSPPQLVSTNGAGNDRSYISPVPGTKIPVPRRKSDLSAFQKHTLNAIAESAKAWRVSTDLWRLYGLPTTREQLHTLLK